MAENDGAGKNGGSDQAEVNYDELLKNFAPRGVNPTPAQQSGTPSAPPRTSFGNDQRVTNNGEVYFSSMNARSAGRNSRTAAQQRSQSSPSAGGYAPVRPRTDGVHTPASRPAASTTSGIPARSQTGPVQSQQSRSAASPKTPAKASGRSSGAKGGGTDAKKPKISKAHILNIVLVFIIIAGISAAITVFAVSCADDIFAVGRTSTIVTVTVTDKMTTSNVIDLLRSKGLIQNSFFCKAVSSFLGYSDSDVYIADTYYLSASMGLENMLNEMQDASTKETVTLTFPEGYTVDRIAAKLESYGVCTASDFYDAINNYDFTGDFAYLKSITDGPTRYRLLEGYLYPDTYQFYLGENATSVVKKFLTNFASKWTDEYAARAAALGLTEDRVIILASIIEKEGNDADQMKQVSSVIHNRLAAMSAYPFLQCDSTSDYISNVAKELLSDDAKNGYLQYYNTYVKSGYPVGPICNPGNDAIYAALYPDDTQYYYFMHDDSGNIYMAKTEEEQLVNKAAIDKAKAKTAS